MRKIILISFIFFGLMAMNSCTKDDVIESSNNDKQMTGKILLKGGDIIKTNSNSKEQVKMRMLYCEWGWGWDGGLTWEILWCDCYGITSNCLPTVTISSNASSYNIFKTHYDNGTISEYFATDEYKSIFPGLDNLDVVNELQNGDIILHLNHDVKMDKDFYIGLPQSVEFSTSDTSWMSQTECVLVIDDDL